MHTLLNKLKSFFQIFKKCLFGRDQNIYRVWFFILLAVLFLIIISTGIAMNVLQSPTEDELFLLIDNDSGVVLNRGLLDEILEFYDQRETEFQAIKTGPVKVADPAR